MVCVRRDGVDGGWSGGAGMACVGGNIESEAAACDCACACRRDSHGYSKRAIMLATFERRGGARGLSKGSSRDDGVVGSTVGDVPFVAALSSG